MTRPAHLGPLLAAGLALAGCDGEPAGVANRWGPDRTWAPLPAERPMPGSAPDDPKAYVGARYRMVGEPGGSRSVEAAGQPVPWLESSAWGYAPAGPGLDGPYFGDQQVYDGRRRMVWFFRLVEPPAPVFNPNPPPAPPMGTTGPPPRPGSPALGRSTVPSTAPAPAEPPRPYEPLPRPPDPPRAVLDVLVLPSDAPQGSGVERGCGPDTVFIVGDDAWRLNRTTGRIERTDADDAACPDDYD